MPQQDIAQALLAAILAVDQGKLSPDRAAAVLAEVVTTGRPWPSLITEWQVLNSTELQSLQSLVADHLRSNGDDPQVSLSKCTVDPALLRAIEKFKLPQLADAVRLTGGNEVANAGADTNLGDHYVTLGSQVASVSPTPQDPYTTGAFSKPTEPVSPAFTMAAAKSTVADAQPQSPAKVPPEVAAVVAPTTPEQRVIPSNTALEVEAHADYATLPPSQAAFESLAKATVQPGDYATLQSGVPTSPDGRSQEPRTSEPLNQDSIPWPLRFRVLREHAKGGLGKVSVAEDLELHREVAFKEIQRRYADDVEARERFMLEAEITGGLEHPGIVPVYGLGSHADGRPYYAMRFIRGRSLQEAIEHYFKAAKEGANPGELQLEFRQLLRRFIDVCNAIDYAHSRGILHRDLKPGNVMLGDYGETLVVDWGIAKAVTVTGSLFKTPMEPLLPKTSTDASQTMMGVAIGTPQFMSPEQAQGKLDELGPASDIYSLGATLYCLLTGVAAFTSRDLNTVLKQVNSGTFPPPAQLNSQVPKPVNAICLKAMALKPALRYGTARALAEDIEHWLADEPVSAYAENRWEKLRRWVRHNQVRAQAIAVTVIVVAFVSTVAAFLIDQSRRAEADALANLKIANAKEIAARQQETKAKAEALRRSKQTRAAIDELLSGMSSALDEFPGMQDARRRLLERAAQDYARLAEEKSGDRELQAEAARSLGRLANVYMKLELVDQARTTLDRADKIWNDLVGGTTTATATNQDYQFALAESNIQRGILESDVGNQKPSSSHFTTAINGLKDLVRDNPKSIDYQDGLGTAYLGLARTEERAGNRPRALADLQQALMLFRTMRTEHPNSIRVLTATAKAQSSFGFHLLDGGKVLEAVKIFEEAISVLDDLVAEFPDNPAHLAERATVRLKLANALRGLGRWPLVVSTDQSCVSDLQEVVRARPDVPVHRENLAIARTNLGQSQRKLGSNTLAVPALEKALENFDELSASFPLPRYLAATANTRNSLAMVLSELGQQEKALELINLAVGDCGELCGLDPNSAEYLEALGIAQSGRGRILSRLGKSQEAVEAFDAAIVALQAAIDKEPKLARYQDQLAWAWTHIGHVRWAAGQTAEAQTAFKNAIDIRAKLLREHGDSPQYQDSSAWLLATCPSADLRNVTRALELANTTTQAIPDSTQYWLTLGATQLLAKQHSDALTSLEKSLKLRGQDEGLTLCLLAIVEAKLKRPEPAQMYLTKAKVWRDTQKKTDEELGYWMKQAEEVVGEK